MNQRVVVIGGGIVGASAAFHLAKAGVETVLVESAITGRATSAGAGIVSPGTSLRPLPPFYELAKPAVAYYPQLVETLRDLDAGETGYDVCGKLMVADTDEKATLMPERLALFEQRRSEGMPNLGNIEKIPPAEARKMLPILGDVLDAMYVPEAARVDGTLLREAMTVGAERLGAIPVRGTAMLMEKNGKVNGVEVDGKRISADRVVVAAGAWTNDVLAAIGYRLPIEPQKGQIIHIEMPGQDTTRWPILDWAGPQYQLCFGPNRVVCGATREFDSGFDTRVTPAGVKEILDEQIRLCPGLANGTIAEVRVGLRPYADDAIPFIGPVPDHPNLIVCSGHGPSGLQLGPYSGLIAAELAQGLTPSTDISSFRLDRPVEARKETEA